MRSGQGAAEAMDERQLEQELAQLNSKLARAEKKYGKVVSGTTPAKAPSFAAAKKKAPASTKEVPRYLQGTATSARKNQADNGRRNISPRPDVVRADHGRAWNSPPKVPGGDARSTTTKRGASKSPGPAARGSGTEDDPEEAKLSRSNIRQPSADADKDRAPSPGGASVGTAASGPAHRVRGMQHKLEPALPDPEADLARLLNMVQLPCTPLVFTKVSTSSVQDRLKGLLDQCLPTQRRLPPPATDLAMMSVSSAG